MSGVLAAVVEQALSDILPHRVRPVEADGVEALASLLVACSPFLMRT